MKKIVLSSIILFAVLTANGQETSPTINESQTVSPIEQNSITDSIYDYKTVFQKPVFYDCDNLTGSDLDICNSKSAQKELLRKLEYPQYSVENYEQGTVYIKFIVNEEGKTMNPEVIRTSNYTRLDEAALTAISKMFTSEYKTAQPAKDIEGNKVKVFYQVPVKFRLIGKKKKKNRKNK